MGVVVENSSEEFGEAVATGKYGHATATGYYGVATATGDFSRAVASGKYGRAVALGEYGKAYATGDQGSARVFGRKGWAYVGFNGSAAAGIDGMLVFGRRSFAVGTLIFGRRSLAVGDDEVLPYVLYRYYKGDLILMTKLLSCESVRVTKLHTCLTKCGGFFLFPFSVDPGVGGV